MNIEFKDLVDIEHSDINEPTKTLLETMRNSDSLSFDGDLSVCLNTHTDLLHQQMQNYKKGMPEIFEGYRLVIYEANWFEDDPTIIVAVTNEEKSDPASDLYCFSIIYFEPLPNWLTKKGHERLKNEMYEIYKTILLKKSSSDKIQSVQDVKDTREEYEV